jgi:PcaR/PcaU/PobR family beta-ketoadipate pathway transcriptional regulator
MDTVVQSLVRGLSVIRAFDADNSRLTLSDVARATGLTRSAARRFLHTLVGLGYVANDGRYFTLRPRVLDLGYAYLSSLSLPDIAEPHLERLSIKTGESASVSVLDGRDVVYVARVATRRIMTVAISVGTRFPAYATSMGRVLLAGQSDEWLAGFITSANLTSLTPYTVTDPDKLREIVTQVVRTVRPCGEPLGYSTPEVDASLGRTRDMNVRSLLGIWSIRAIGNEAGQLKPKPSPASLRAAAVWPRLATGTRHGRMLREGPRHGPSRLHRVGGRTCSPGGGA